MDTMQVDNNCSQQSEIESQKSIKRTIFSPPLSCQRYVWVQEFLEQNTSIRTVTDVGCGNGRMLNWLKGVPHLVNINCLDVDYVMLEDQIGNYFRPNLFEMLLGRRTSTLQLNINVYHGDVVVPDDRLQSDCFLLVEMIEHIPLDHVNRACRTIFSYYKPQFVIVTTPNFEFNHLLRGEGESQTKFRHFDHKFEWTRAEFVRWAQEICSNYSYNVKFDGVGHLPSSEPFGPCTQIAVFEKQSTISTPLKEESACFELFLNKLAIEEGLPENYFDKSLKKIGLMATFDIPGNTQTSFPNEAANRTWDFSVTATDDSYNDENQNKEEEPEFIDKKDYYFEW